MIHWLDTLDRKSSQLKQRAILFDMLLLCFSRLFFTVFVIIVSFILSLFS